MTLAFLLATLVLAKFVSGAPDYWAQRAQFVEDEQREAIGGDLPFLKDEQFANSILMQAKNAELDEAFSAPRKFKPSQNFMMSLGEIQNSDVFKFIKKMPKGAVLHVHDTSITSQEFVLHNITYRPNLYLCDDNGEFRLQFFDSPGRDCAWKLLSDVRKNDKESINRKILEHMSLITSDPRTEYPDVDSVWNKFIGIFQFITPMLTFRPVYEDHFYQGLKEHYDDGVSYVELRTTLPTLYELDGTQYGPLDIVRIYKKVTDRFMQDYPDFWGVKLIYAPSRKVDQLTFDSYLSIAREIKQAYPNFVIGFDLVGQEDKGETLAKFAKDLQGLREDMDVYFHSGETNWYGMTDENLVDAVLLKAKRIGHGYALLKHPKVAEYVKNNKVAIEVNPISNQVLNLVDDLRNHPANYLFAENYPVIISSDDPGLWGAEALSYDFYEAFMGMMSRTADIRALKKIIMNSIIYSGMTKSEKNKAFDAWKQKWNEFVQSFRSTS